MDQSALNELRDQTRLLRKILEAVQQVDHSLQDLGVLAGDVNAIRNGDYDPPKGTKNY